MVLAHGGVEGALPMPLSLFLYGLVAIVAVALLVLRARPDPVLGGGGARVLPGWVQAPARVGHVLLAALGLVGWAVVLTAALFGNASPATNVAWLALSTGFLALFPIVSVVFGDVWRAVSPYRTLGRAIERVAGADAEPPAWARWLAPVAVGSLLWMLLAPASPDLPRPLGWWLLGYSVVVLGGAFRWGMAWVERVEGFGVLFSALASLAVLHRTPEGLAAGPPLVRARDRVLDASAVAVLLVAVAGSLFDGFSLTDPWIEVIGGYEDAGWALVSTVGLVVAVFVVAAVWLGLGRVLADPLDRPPEAAAVLLGGALVPLTAGALLAHDLPQVLIEGQFLPILASDPYGEGWDLFGTASNAVDFELLSSQTFAWLESAVVALGAVGSMLVGHDLLTVAGRRRLPRALTALAVVVALAAVASAWLVLGSAGD